MLALQPNNRFFRLAALSVVGLWSIIFLYRYFFTHHDSLPSTPYKPTFVDKISSQITAPFHKEVSSEYSIKPIVYNFPQYYPFEQNDRIWGANFTEWDNVKKADHNFYGLETIRPHPSIGYYNGLEFATRQRHGRLIRENGFHGMVYHHYWMSGIPVMDHILQAMLIDGEPNTPFMLSWANGPWTANWDGLDSGVVFLAQDYGDIEDWRKHFDWLLPFFKHPNYIRSEGKVQFVIYWPAHMERRATGAKFHMLAAFRKWAREEGVGGMDIIETRQDENPTSYMADAINEFQPHTGGTNQEQHHVVERNSRIYHRGSLICWDTTPRHATDGRAAVWPTCHPHSWQYHMVRAMKKIKEDPNPRGVENFLFINALNEWGEGSTIEPSIQFGNAYQEAMKEAVRISEKKHIWKDQDLAQALVRTVEYNASVNKTATPDVCVLIYHSHQYGLHQKFNTEDMIRSLQAQNNTNWRAVVVAPDGAPFDHILLARMDHRVKFVPFPSDIQTAELAPAYDWLIRNISDAGPECANAKYMLLTNGGNEYAPTAFDAVTTTDADFVALNLESRWTVKDANPALSWQDLCTRLENPLIKLFRASAPLATEFDLSATFISLPKFLSTLGSSLPLSDATLKPLNLNLSSYPASTTTPPFHQLGGLLAELLVTSHGWTWAAPTNTEEAHVRSNPSYNGCKEAGHIWIDSLNFTETGCYSSPDIGTLYGGWADVDLGFYRRNGWCTKKSNVTQGEDGITKILDVES